MFQLTNEQRVFVVEQYYENKSPTKVKRAFFCTYKANINVKTINSLVSKWKQNGTVHNRNKSNSGRSKHVRTEENVSNVWEIIKDCQSRSEESVRSKKVYGPYFFEEPANSNNAHTVTTEWWGSNSMEKSTSFSDAIPFKKNIK